MNVRDFEGWLAASLSAQPWAGTVTRWSTDGGPKPVGVTVGAASMQLVKAESGVTYVGGWLHPPPAGPVQAAPTDAVSWAQAIAQVVQVGQHPGVRTVQTYAEWGGSSKPGGVRVELVDGSQFYGSILDVARR
ncbi:hypothetical protein ACGFIW_01215 [Micromonospora sp. NPDC048935]|uniref:hypothetical protein n=1 Tax=Micromonospora sp. NPDC048935 TaxID=3364262 RepID=UPI00372082D8